MKSQKQPAAAEVEGPWEGSYVAVEKKDGTKVTGQFSRWLPGRFGRSLELFCDWGTSSIPERAIASLHCS